MSTLSPIYPLNGTISSGRVVSGTVNRLGNLSGQLGTRGLVEPAVEVFHFTVSPNNRITFTDLTVERITDAIHYGKVVLALLFKQHSSYEEYKGLVLTKYEASGKYYFSSVADGYDYVISTINGGVIWDYTVSRTDGEVLAELNTVNKGSLVSAINEVLNVATDSSVHDYERLNNKPQVNSVTLIGNKTSSQLGLADAFILATTQEINGLFN